MKLKTFREFIKENFRTSLVGRGLIDQDTDEETEINFYHEKIKTINLRQYMATFVNNKSYEFLTNPIYGKTTYLRFFLLYYDNSFTIYIFNGNISHVSFVDLIDSYAKKPKSINIESFSELYAYSYQDYNPEEEKNKLEELKTIWCLPGLYNKGKIKAYASPSYINLLAKSGIHEKLGFDDNSWKSINET